jgi:hypothetical protein
MVDGAEADHIDVPTPEEAAEQLESMLIRPSDVPELQWIPEADQIDPALELGPDVAVRRRAFLDGQVVLSVTLFDPRPGVLDAGWFAAVVASPATDQETLFDVTSIDPASMGKRWSEEGRVVTTLARPHGGLVVAVTHDAPTAVDVDDVGSLLGQLLRIQLDRAVVDPLAEPVPEDTVQRNLRELLVAEPGTGSFGETRYPLPLLSGPFDRTLLMHLSNPDDRLAAELEAFGPAWRRSFVDVRSTVSSIIVWDLGSADRAGVMLGRLRDALPGVAQQQRTNLFTGTASSDDGEYAFAFGRRDRFLYNAVIETELPTTEAAAEAVSLAMLQRERLPAGAEAVVNGLSRTELAAGVVGAASAGFGLLVVVRLIGLRSGRRYAELNVPRPAPAGVDDAAISAMELRSRGSVLGLALFGALMLVLIGLVPLTWPAGLVAGAVGAVAIPVLLARRRRVERPMRVKRIGFRRRRLVRVVLVSIATCLVVLLGLLLVAWGALTSVVPLSYESADLDRRVGGHLSTILATIGIALLLLGVLLARVARRQFRLRAADLLVFDDRPPVLYLRGFVDDQLRVPSIVSGRRNVTELLSPAPNDYFENIVSWQLDAVGPTIALAPPGGSLSSLAAAREYATGEEWMSHVESRIDEAAIVAISLSATDGLLREVRVATERALARIVLIFPPVAADELRRRWAAVRAEIAIGVDTALPLDPALILCACFHERRVVAVVADRRDEAGYRAAITRAAGRVQTG